MSIDLVRRLAGTGLAVVATTRADGTVHATLVSAGVMDDPVTAEPVVAFVLGGATRKLARLRQTGQATATFVRGYEWVSVDGPVRLVGPDDPDPSMSASVPSVLRAVFSAAGGTHDDWDEYDRVMAAERRTAVFLRPDRIITNR